MHGKHHSHLPLILAKLFGAAFIVCFFWQFLLPADLHEFHMMFMRISILGFSGFNIASFILGLIQAVLWGLLVGWYVVAIKHWLWKKCPHDHMKHDCKHNCDHGEKNGEPKGMEHHA